MDERDVEKLAPRERFIATLRRAADALEKGESFRVQIANERLTIPENATLSIEHEREEEDGQMVQELELQFRWKVDL